MLTADDSISTMIIGAGPAGLSAALELDRAGAPFVLVDRADGVGGLSRTWSFHEGDLEFRTDNGPHRFFSKNPYLYGIIGDLIDEQWFPVTRCTRQWIDGVFFDYPINPPQVVRNLGPWMLTRVLFDYLRAAVKYRVLGAPIRTFEDFALASFGRTLAQFNILNYTEKVWGMPCDQLHPDWAGQRIRGVDLLSLATDALRRALGLGSGEARSMVAEFLYPSRGTGLIYEAIRERVEGNGHPVWLNTRPVQVRRDGQRVTAVVLAGPEGERVVEVQQLIESVHLPDLLGMMDPPPPEAVLQAASRLRFRCQVYLFITLDRERVTHDQWVYFPDAAVPFERWSEMRNFSAAMSPPGKTSLFVEFFCFEDDPKWTMSAEQLLELVLPVAERGAFFSRQDVRRIYRLRGGRDYPIYDLPYRENLALIRTWLDGFTNLQWIGRPGRFKYTNQDHAMEMGILAARAVLDGQRRDLEAVGGEGSYFESGPARPRVREDG